MKLSVIIPCYNAESTLADQLESLAGQHFSSPWEVIIADNGSTDNTISLAQSFHRSLPQLKIVRAAARRGAAHARNRGARAAASEYLAFCDADDAVGEGYLQAVFEALTRHECIACRYEFRKLNHRWISRLTGPQLTGLDRGLMGPFVYAGGGSIAVRKSVHDSVGGFDEDNFPILQDTDYCIRIQRSGVPLQFVPEAVVHYRWRATAWGAFSQARSWGRDCIGIRARHWPMKSAPDSPRSLLPHFLKIRHLRSTEQLAAWIWATGWKVGSIEGWRLHLRNKTAGISTHTDPTPEAASEKVRNRPLPPLS